eukprot:TRINITY_DN5402_c0_g1_i1.p1 TRINITY_DN5402_c0_g1~~TRINITY_DN5402_c0_g1_i1.p1  ORF type:complete len:316 (-),score=66.89 TRINITY_DN5402_c0_g1_i1:164-1111(-)
MGLYLSVLAVLSVLLPTTSILYIVFLQGYFMRLVVRNLFPKVIFYNHSPNKFIMSKSPVNMIENKDDNEDSEDDELIVESDETVDNGKNENNDKPRIALTIDDAPTKNTKKILKLLKKYNVKATFFIISSKGKKRKNTVLRMLREGHEIANHMERDRCSLKLPEEEFSNSFYDCHKLLLSVYNEHYNLVDVSENEDGVEEENHEQILDELLKIKKNLYYRPGGGLFNSKMINNVQNGVHETIKKGTYKVVLASIYPWDGNIVSSSKLISWHLKYVSHENGIIVIHDRPFCPGALEMSLEYLTSKFTIVTLSELLN